MVPRSTIATALLAALSSSSLAQHGGTPTAAPTPTAEAKQFDFLVGRWDLAVTPAVTSLAARIHGVPKMLGTWKAWRALDGFGVEDEIRITDESGNPRALSHAVRFYDVAAHHWATSTLDVYRATFTQSTSEWREGVMSAGSRGTDAEGHAYQTRSRFHEITPTSFAYQQERSTDDGRTWTTTLTVRAKRVAATADR